MNAFKQASKHCKIHGDCAHSTDECQTLKKKKEEKARKGKGRKRKKEKEKEKACKADKSMADSELDLDNNVLDKANHVHISQKLKQHISVYIMQEPESHKQQVIVDSGALTHMTLHAKWIVPGTYKPAKAIHKVHLGDDSILEGHGTGTVQFTTQGCPGKQITVDIANVLLVPKLSTTLISVPKLMESDLSINFEKRKCTINHSGKGKTPCLTASYLQPTNMP
jgi:predicted ribosome-associated RNA-binding protein Tma20